ncbi:hypothetical protein [Sandaracinus amylolyticus]|uniref:TPR domain protein, putative component of TonB system n=1 Tax=Sandaracinus amylolyticus TaxID=927083 RepID=A0A0F6SFW0_9BACT|nr:hypothetical protein [Sandaracinus amylolyticus]AKF07629.1 TPR domain protein, putative component of TonB system [Sandaracinus amylolyticus]
MTEVWAPSPSPIARFLLELDERGAEGAVEVGERTVVLRRGRVVDVRRAPGDPSLHEFLAKTGRIREEERAALGRLSADPDRLPEGSTLLSHDALAETLRALWLDRLVRGMAKAESEGRAVPPLRPEAPPPHVAAEASLVPLVLDALERRAAEGDAEQVGARATHRLEWLQGPHTARARRWAGLDAAEKSAKEPRIAAFLMSAPAAASRIAALVRAGLARVVTPGASAPAPARRLPSLPAPAPAPEAVSIRPGNLSIPPARSASIPPPRPAAVQLSPGAAQAFAQIETFDLTLPELPPATRALDDALDPLEREIAVLEESGAPAVERAAAWRAAAETWLERYASVEERERALREAAAALAEDPETLLAAADACAACAHTDLALAYGRAAVGAAGEGPRRDDVLIAYALLARRIGRTQVALSALRAASGGARAADARAITASIVIAQGRPADAADELLGAATQLGESDPEGAAYLVGWAWSITPGHERAADAMAAWHAAAQRGPAIIALRADAARRASEPDVRRRLRLEAAERAEMDERPLLAAEMLLRALDDEPELEVLYEPLDVDLEAAGALVERAVVLEELATVCPPEARLSWLTRAADARLEIPGDGSWELELRIRCLEVEPTDEGARAAIRQQAEAAADPMLLADALERAIRASGWTSDAARAAALEDLARIADDVTHEPLRAAWARSVAAALGGEPMSKARARFESTMRPAMARAAELDRLSRQGERAERRDATRGLAAILAQDPERRERAISLLAGMIDEGWDDGAGDLLERILTLRGDVPGRIQVLEQRVEHEGRRIERVRRLLRIAGLEAVRGDHRAAARACLRVLNEVPGHREAIVRLRRAASRLGDDALVRDALARESRLALAPPERARALTALAARCESAGDREGARVAAIDALLADPEAAEAALILARRLATDRGSAPPDAIARARALVGDLPPLLAAAVRAAPREHDRLDAIERWARLATYQAEPWRDALQVALEQGEIDLVVRAVEALTRDPRCEPASIGPIADALSALDARGAVERAAALAVSSADRFGEAGVPLREIASALAQRAGSPIFVIAALERRLAASSDEDAIATLREIAAQHARGGDVAGEARALLRVLARVPRDEPSITRLAEIYASTGEHDRLMAALALRVAEGATDDERFEGRLALAAASMQVLGDPSAAESFARAALEELPPVADEPALQRVAKTAGVLVAIDCPEAGVAVMRDEARRAEGAWAGRLWERAAARAARHAGDVALAIQLIHEGLRAVPGHGALLVAFEQLALERQDVEDAKRTYDELITHAMGASGRRALLYRRARWLERAGAERDALEAYLEAARHAASSGVILTAVERLARATGDLDALARGLLVLAENAPHPMVRLSMIRRAATLLDQEIGRPEHAWEVLFPVWKETGLSELEEELGRLGARMGEASAELGERAFGELFGELARRADEAWMADEKARLTMKAARLHALARGDLARAEQLADEALAALRAEEPEPSKIAGVLAELASWLRRDPRRREDARAKVREALEADPTSDDAKRVAAELGVAAPSGPASLASAVSVIAHPAPSELPAPVPSYATSPSYAPSPSPPSRASTPERARPVSSANGHAAPSPSLRPSRPPVALPEPDEEEPAEPGDRPSRMDLWLPAPPSLPPAPGGPSPIAMPVSEDEPLDDDALDDLEARARALAASDDDLLEAAALLRAALVIDPGRAAAIELLGEIATRAGARGAAYVAHAVLSAFDPRRSAPAIQALDARSLADARGTLLRNPAHESARRLLALVWESALPLFRVSLQQLGILGTDRVGPHTGSGIGRALAATLDALPEGDDVTLFATRGAGTGVVPIRTHPPAVLVGADAPGDDRSLRFLLGRAIELARPEHVLLATLSDDEGRTLYAALRAAFGPAEGAQVAREAAALASQLWRTIPTRNQRDVRELLLDSESTLDWDAQRASVLGGAARAGLVASGDVRASIAALRALEAQQSGTRPPSALEDAVAESGALADLLRFAFGDAFIGALR